MLQSVKTVHRMPSSNAFTQASHSRNIWSGRRCDSQHSKWKGLLSLSTWEQIFNIIQLAPNGNSLAVACWTGRFHSAELAVPPKLSLYLWESSVISPFYSMTATQTRWTGRFTAKTGSLFYLVKGLHWQGITENSIIKICSYRPPVRSNNFANKGSETLLGLQETQM